MRDSFSIVTHKESVNGWHLHMMGGEFWSSMTDQERCAAIQAVPLMLEALRLGVENDIPTSEWLRIARAAIALAEGK